MLILDYEEWIKDVYNDINEEFVGNFKGMELYKNPKSVKRMDKYIRGLLDTNGNMYVAHSSAYLHFMILKVLNQIGLIHRMAITDPKRYYKNPDEIGWVAIERQSDTKDFHIAYFVYENMSKRKYEFIDKVFKKAKIINPQYNFISDSVVSY